MIIQVRGYLTYRDVIGKREFEKDDDIPISLQDFLRELSTEIAGEHGRAIYDEDAGVVGKYVAIIHNGRHINHLPDRLDTILKDQDEIAIFPPGAGG